MRMFIEADVGGAEALARIRDEGGLGLFVRSLVGLDRAAAKAAFNAFIAGRKLSASQLEFVNMIVDHLSNRGVIDPRLLYESPFTDIDLLGVAGVFPDPDVGEIVGILEAIRGRAAA